jgi:hypothetical protein
VFEGGGNGKGRTDRVLPSGLFSIFVPRRYHTVQATVIGITR